MAADALTVRVLLAIGDGRPSEVATFPLTLHAVVHKDDVAGLPHAFVEVDHAGMHEALRRRLHELADAIPKPPSGSLFDEKGGS